MLAHDNVHGHHMGAHSRKLLQQCARLVPGPGHCRAITTTCAKRGSNSLPGFLGTTWETGKLPKSVRAFEPNNMESGLVRGASVVRLMPWSVRPLAQCMTAMCLVCRCGLITKPSSFREGHISCGTMVDHTLYSLLRKPAAQRQQQNSKRLHSGELLDFTRHPAAQLLLRLFNDHVSS